MDIESSTTAVKDESIAPTGVQFLMSLAGMFESHTSDTSTKVREIVTESILAKHGK